MALGQTLTNGGDLTDELAAVTDWFDPSHFVAAPRRRSPLLIQHGRPDPIGLHQALPRHNT